MTKILTIALAATVGCSAAAMAFYALTVHRRRKVKKQMLKQKEFAATAITPSISLESVDWDQDEPELLKEQLSRNIAFFGEQAVDRLRSSFVVVIGVGGVGSHCAVHLVRSGVGRVRLIDFDQVTLSSLNRHACATRSDVGRPKVEAMRNHFRSISPSTVVEACVELFSKERATDLLLSNGKPDFVVDCIDNMETKLDLLEFCHAQQIPVVSSMGSACKADPSRIQIADISETSEDTLARAVRSKLRLRGISSGIPVVYSTERPRVSIMPLQPEAAENPDDFAALPNFRVRILPVLGAIPAMFGAALSSYVLCKLAEFPMEPLPIKNTKSVYLRMYRDFISNERRLDPEASIFVSQLEAGWLFDECFGGRSAISGATSTKLLLTRWYQQQPATLGNLVLMTVQESEQHSKIADSKESIAAYYDPQVLKNVEGKLRDQLFQLSK